ncbi:methylated-DNA--[protein]-cysteine S-methyltransferase [Microbacterium sp. NPDC076911]|uniref:methylated-DNA--[protein]-cysteine S-methyltransferase n=1 Tax=Microbacterium sp. NPDC076911 TaxID=3154958 RepID=UPI00343BE531
MTSPETPRYRVCPSPIGDIVIVEREGSLVTVHPFDGPVYAEVARLSMWLRAAVQQHPESETGVISDTIVQLEEYFAGDREGFDLPLDWSTVQGFTRDALQAVCEIPYGETAGYGEVAIAAGSPRAARAVGTACAHTPFSIVVPVHRVVRSDGSLGEYGGHPEVKKYLIDLERGTSA